MICTKCMSSSRAIKSQGGNNDSPDVNSTTSEDGLRMVVGGWVVR